MVEQVKRQASRSGSYFDNPVRGTRQPAEDAGVQALRGGQPVVELRFEPVQQLPGQGRVGLRIAVPIRYEAACLVAGEHGKVLRRVAPAQVPTPPGRTPRG